MMRWLVVREVTHHGSNNERRVVWVGETRWQAEIASHAFSDAFPRGVWGQARFVVEPWDLL